MKLRLLLVCSALTALACGGLAPTDPTMAGGAPMQPVQPANYGQQGAGVAPSNAYTIQGPYQGDDGAILWIDSLGHMTGMYAEGYLAFGMNNQLFAARDPYGTWYGVNNGQLYPIQGMPQELMSWPGVQTMLPGGYTLPAAQQMPVGYASGGGGGGGGYDPSLQVMQNVNDMVNQTNMTIIDNMSSPSTDYYDSDYQYIGSW